MLERRIQIIVHVVHMKTNVYYIVHMVMMVVVMTKAFIPYGEHTSVHFKAQLLFISWI